MKRPQLVARVHLLASLCLVLAFQLTIITNKQAIAIQQASEQQQHNAAQSEQQQQHSSAPMMSLGSESSSALETSAALAGDDLIAAESAQSADSAEHKTFTNAQVVRQESQQQQMAASVAPIYAPAAPQQQQQQQQQAQFPHQQLFGHLNPNQMALHSRMQHPQQKAFNPFMAAALAGNYGPAQQQMAAAAAAANMQHAHPHPQQQQLQSPHPQQSPQHHYAQLSPHHAPLAHAGPQTREPQAALESTVRQNVVPAPNFNAMLDSNSIEMSNDQPANNNQVGVGSQSLAVASSGQHPVIASSGASGSSSMQETSAWPLQAPDIPKIVNLEVKCEKNLMKVSIEFDKVFNGVIFSKGHYNQNQCLHVNQNSGKQQAYFDISINSCGTAGNTQNGLYGMGGNTGSGTYFENTIVVQYDPNVQEVYDHARKLRCTWHDQYEKAVTFRPFPVDMMDIVRADFAGDNVGCWMQIQVGKGPWASEVAGIVKIGQTMTMVLAIKDEENKFDMLVRNCFAHDGKRGPIELVDKSGCITRPKLMSRFTKIKNFGSSATVLSYAHFQAFKFPDSMEVHFQCTIQICRHQCPDQCSAGTAGGLSGANEAYSESTISGTFNIHGGQAQPVSEAPAHLRKFGSSGASLSRERRDVSSRHFQQQTFNGSQQILAASRPHFLVKPMTQSVGLNRVIQVVSSGDLAFAFGSNNNRQEAPINGSFEQLGDQLGSSEAEFSASRMDPLSGNQICMSSYNFVLSLVMLVLILLSSSLIAISLHLRHKSLAKRSSKLLVTPSSSSSSPSSPSHSSSQCSSANSTMLRSGAQMASQSSLQRHHQAALVYDYKGH